MDYTHAWVRTDGLVPNPWNPNKLGPEAEAKLDASLRKFGFFKPLLVREKGGQFEILGGQHRWESALRQGLDKVPIINLGPIDDVTAKQIGLADNSRYGADDAKALVDVLNSLPDLSDLTDFLPITTSEIDDLFRASEIDLDSLGFDDEKIDLADPGFAGGPSHQIMRFKVPLEDAEWISEKIEQVTRIEGFRGSDALTNAGDALVHVLRRAFGDE